MHILRYRRPGSSQARVGLVEQGRVSALDVGSLASLWSLPLDVLREKLGRAGGESEALADVEVLAPIDGRTEVWAAGVTYVVSREAHVEESERAASAYELVYDADRPELFFKSAAWRVVGDGGTIAVRSDSAVTVPEPEVALVINAFGQVVGYTICDDVSSRSIEGENPLYLPQAKIYLGACALGPMVRPAWEVPDPYALRIELTIHRSGEVAWRGDASTSRLHRRYDELVGYLMRADLHPDGVVLSTGTCLVPPAPFTLQAGRRRADRRGGGRGPHDERGAGPPSLDHRRPGRLRSVTREHLRRCATDRGRPRDGHPGPRRPALRRCGRWRSTSRQALGRRPDLHRAARVGADQGVGAGGAHVGRFAVPKFARRPRLQQVVDTGRTATQLTLGDLAALEAGDGVEQGARRVTDPLGVGQVTSVVIGDCGRDRVTIGARPHLHQELGQVADLGRELLGTTGITGVVTSGGGRTPSWPTRTRRR